MAIQQGMESEPSAGNDMPNPTQDETIAIPERTNSFNYGSVSTNSMVTVRLSDATVSPSMVDASTREGVMVGRLNYDDECALEDDSPITGGNRNSVSFSEDLNYMEEAHRASTISMPSILEETLGSASSTLRSRSDSSGTFSSVGSAHVDWEELERSEEQAPRDEGSDESTAFLLARLEQENNALAKDPKAALARARSTRNRSKSRPPSIQQLKRLVNEPAAPSLRYSMIPEPPPMTELEFWAALVADYPQTVQRLPTLTSNKIRGGIPLPLRGVVWTSVAGARDRLLEDEYERLCGETSPYENLIGKDIGRSFPNVEMFRDPSGDGQQMLGRVLKCFSLYDNKIGYCQGLGFVVGPLLMNMGDKEAFCVLVRLMEHYDLRSCFLPDLSGLHLRIYQFQHLLSQHLPTLTAHLEALQVEPLYVSQWFLSFFAVTCPLPMLLRIYDVILTEGASETLMRVALSLMRRNEAKILGCTEFEDVMSLLLSRGLWDTYGSNADDLVNDFVGLTGLVSRESLEKLEGSFKEAHTEDSVAKSSVPSVQAAASRFLGRFMIGSSSANKITSPTSSLSVATPSRPSSLLRRTPSKQSMASTLNSIESSESHLSTTSTEATAMSRNPSAECTPGKPNSLTAIAASPFGMANKDRDLHNQIEDLLTALSDMQREQALLASELQKEREEREEDRLVVQRFLERARQNRPLKVIDEGNKEGEQKQTSSSDDQTGLVDFDDYMGELEQHFTLSGNKRSSILLSKHQMREDLKLWKDQYELEVTRSAKLLRQLTDQETENARLLEQFRETRSRMQEAHTDKQRLEKTVQELRSRRSSYDVVIETASPIVDSPGGLREFKLGRSGSVRSQTSPAFSKRSSSLGIQAVLATEDHKPPAEEALLLELVNSKTSEAVARQELEEVKGKLDSLRRLMGGSTSSPTASGHRPSPSEPCIVKPTSIGASSLQSGPAARAAQEGLKVTPPATSGGGFFSGWGKRMPSNPVLTAGNLAS